MKINFKKSMKISGNSTDELNYMCPSKDYIFFTQINSKYILGLNRRIKSEVKIKTPYELGAIYFDSNEEVFWATSLKSNGQIYKINLKGEILLTIDILSIIPKDYFLERNILTYISGITLNNNNEILISIKDTNYICIIDINGNFKEVIYNLPIEPITDIKFIDNKLFLNCNDKVYLYDYEFNFLDKADINYKYINSFIINKVSYQKYKILFLLSFRNAKHLCWGELFLELSQVSTDENSLIKEIKEDNNNEKNNNIYKIIELIAEEELALVNIINAEGEKIKHIINNNNNVDELILANKSVNTVLDKMVKIEIALTNKLREVENIAEKFLDKS